MIRNYTAEGLSVEVTGFVIDVNEKLIYEYISIIGKDNINIKSKNDDNVDIPF